MRKPPALLASVAAVLLAACQSSNSPGGSSSGHDDVTEQGDDVAHPYDGIAENEKVQFTGTEPFWGGDVSGRTLTYKTPENPTGEVVQVGRFAGRGGLSYSGKLAGADFTMTITPLACSDGMSDRSYPFTVTLKLGPETRNGCAWTERQPFEGPAHP